MLSHVFFGLFDADAVVFRDRVKLGKAVSELLQLVNLLVSQLFSLFVLFF